MTETFLYEHYAKTATAPCTNAFQVAHFYIGYM